MRRNTADAIDAELGVNTRYRDLAPHQRAMLEEILRSCRRRRRYGTRRLRALNVVRYRRVKRLLERVEGE